MSRLKVFTGFSAIISLFMCVISSSPSFLFSIAIMDYDIRSTSISEIISEAFSVREMSSLNFILVFVFLLNIVSIMLYLICKNEKLVKYFSFSCILLLVSGIVLFLFNVIAFIKFFNLLDTFEYFTSNYIISRWIPRILIFTIPTSHLILTHIYLMTKSIKLNYKFVILNIYIFCIFITTTLAFFSFSSLSDFLVGCFRLKTSAIIRGDQIIGDTYANINYYIYYILALTLLFGAIFGISGLISKNRKKQQTLKA